jgi:hypothetical protein
MPSKVPAPPIERTGAPEPLESVQIEEVGANQYAKATTGVGQRRRVAPGDDRSDEGCGQRRHEDWQSDSDPSDRLSKGMTDRGTARSRNASSV